MDNEQAAVQLPQYQCHKKVRAAKITGTKILKNSPKLRLEFGDIGGSVDVTMAFFQKHQPEIGGYYVQYEDGYESYSPATAFEEGYTRMDSDPIPPEFNSPLLGKTREPTTSEEKAIDGLIQQTSLGVFQGLNRFLNERKLLLSIDTKQETH